MDTEPRELLRTAMRVSNTLRAHGVRFALAGGCAVYAHGGPASDHDVDVFVTERDAPVARKVLVAAGMRAVDPPEDWLTKVYDGNCLVDLVFRPNGRPVTPEALDRAEVLRLGATTAPVVPATDLMVDKLLVLEARGVGVTDEDRARIESCGDVGQLEVWLTRAATAETVGELFEPGGQR